MKAFFARLLFQLGRQFISSKEAKLDAEAKHIIDNVGKDA